MANPPTRLGPAIAILVSQALSVEPSRDIAKCPGPKTLNFSHEALADWRKSTKFSDGIWAQSLSLWNTSSIDVNALEWFDYWAGPGLFIQYLAQSAAYQRRVLYLPDISQTACGAGWDCRYTISFIGPGYNCEVVNTRSSSDHTTRTAAPPFGEGILIPRGNYSYYTYATGGEYSYVQMENVSAGGIPLEGPPFPKDFGAFRTEPVIWVGHTIMTGSGPIPQNREYSGWNDYFTARVFRCDMFETRYTVDFNHYQGIQSTQVVDREYLKPLINTTYLPDIDATDGTNDKITAFPKDEYVYPKDKERYRYVGAFHALGLVFRDLLGGSVDSKDILYPSWSTRAIWSKAFDPLKYYFTDDNLMERMQDIFEDILLSTLSNPKFLAASFAADPSRITEDQGMDETTKYPCTRSKPENRFRYQPLTLGAVYGVSVILSAAAVAVGTMSVVQNRGALKNTRFSSIATLLQHCGYSLENYRQPTSRGDEAGGT